MFEIDPGKYPAQKGAERNIYRRKIKQDYTLMFRDFRMPLDSIKIKRIRIPV